MTELKAGLRLKSAVCDAEVMVVKAGGDDALTCGGLPMLSGDESAGASEAAADHMDGCQVGKRYVNEDQSLEVLCVKAGRGRWAPTARCLRSRMRKSCRPRTEP